MELIPVGDRIIVRPLPREKKVGSLFIPDNAKRPPMIGDVLAAGPGRTSESGMLIPSPVKAGDRIVFGRFAGNEVKVQEDQEPVVIMSLDDVQAILDPETRNADVERVKDLARPMIDSGQPAHIQELARAALNLAERYVVNRIASEAAA